MVLAFENRRWIASSLQCGPATYHGYLPSAHVPRPLLCAGFTHCLTVVLPNKEGELGGGVCHGAHAQVNVQGQTQAKTHIPYRSIPLSPLAALPVYANHPEHQKVLAEHIVPLKEDVMAMDYEHNVY